MTDKQERFCQEYVIDLNPIRAYMAVYKNCSSERSASAAAARLLADVNISVRVRELKEKVAEKTEITAEEVLRDLIEVKNRCMQSVPVKVWSPEEHAYVDSDAEYTFDSKGANTALKMLGEYCGMFEKKIRLSGVEEEQSKLSELLRQRRERREKSGDT